MEALPIPDQPTTQASRAAFNGMSESLAPDTPKGYKFADAVVSPSTTPGTHIGDELVSVTNEQAALLNSDLGIIDRTKDFFDEHKRKIGTVIVAFSLAASGVLNTEASPAAVRPQKSAKTAKKAPLSKIQTTTSTTSTTSTILPTTTTEATTTTTLDPETAKAADLKIQLARLKTVPMTQFKKWLNIITGPDKSFSESKIREMDNYGNMLEMRMVCGEMVLRAVNGIPPKVEMMYVTRNPLRTVDYPEEIISSNLWTGNSSNSSTYLFYTFGGYTPKNDTAALIGQVVSQPTAAYRAKDIALSMTILLRNLCGKPFENVLPNDWLKKGLDEVIAA